MEYFQKGIFAVLYFLQNSTTAPLADGNLSGLPDTVMQVMQGVQNVVSFDQSFCKRKTFCKTLGSEKFQNEPPDSENVNKTMLIASLRVVVYTRLAV